MLNGRKVLLSSVGLIVVLLSQTSGWAQESKDCPYPIKEWDGPSVTESLNLKLSKMSRPQAIGSLLAEYKRPPAQSHAIPILFYLAATEETAKLKALYEELGQELSGGLALNKALENYPERKGFKVGQKTLSDLCKKLVPLNQKAEK